MQLSSWIKRGVCIACAAAAVLSFSACGKNKKAEVSEVNPWSVSDPGKMVSGGYELPYDYSDNYKAIMKVVDGSEFKTASKTPAGNIVFHFTTSKTEDEVKKLYDDYFATLPKVKAKNKNDISPGWFDKEKRMVLFNLNIWTADGKTNYKLGAEACDKLEDSATWEKAE